MKTLDVPKKKVAIVGGGPSGLFVLKGFAKSNCADWEIHIFEKTGEIGPGMPYSSDGANYEHITNVSGNEIPELVTDIKEWIKHEPRATLLQFGIDPDNFHEYKVLPRLLFGKFLTHQYQYLRVVAKSNGLAVTVHYNTEVIDVVDSEEENEITVVTADKQALSFNHVIICTGHLWQKRNEGVIANYFDSPYPPAKLNLKLNHAVAIRGASLSAIDAIKTIALNNGTFTEVDGNISYQLSEGSEDFKIVMHSRNGLLPAFRFHLEQPDPSKQTLLTADEVLNNRALNEGFLSLDYVFENKFKQPLQERDPAFYQQVKALSLEEFTNFVIQKRMAVPPFELFEAEFLEAERSIQEKQSIHWKESLAELSFILNYPAKYLSAEDMLRFRKVLMPLISVVIAFTPQKSGQQLMALHKAHVLSVKAVGDDSFVVPEKRGGATYHTDEPNEDAVYYETYIDCTGQSHLDFEDLPFPSLLDNQTITGAQVKFRSAQIGKTFEKENEDKVDVDKNGNVYLRLPGIAINDNFQVVNKFGALNDRLYIMAVPFISGYNPDYSGLDFCERASKQIVSSLLHSSK